MTTKITHRDDITSALVARLVAAQFPQWAGLPVRPVALSGWDNRTFHLGDSMSVRLPSAAGYASQVAKEHRWLPLLAPQLPLPIPVPLVMGQPNDDYPWPWSIYRWLAGQPATVARIDNLPQFATALGQFLAVLQRIDAHNGPAVGPHSAFRGGPLTTYDAETRQTIDALRDKIDVQAATAVWETALGATWHGSPVWFHGDVAVGNLLVTEGQLSAVIDWGCAGVGDPACDSVIAWTLFGGDSRAAFRAALPLDEATWTRGRGWALWKALITIAEHLRSDPLKAEEARRVVGEVTG